MALGNADGFGQLGLSFKQTGTLSRKDGGVYRIARSFQCWAFLLLSRKRFLSGLDLLQTWGDNAPMSHLENNLAIDVYAPTANVGQTEPISFPPDLYGDNLGSLDQWNSRESCLSFNQSQFRMLAENEDGMGSVVSCSA